MCYYMGMDMNETTSRKGRTMIINNGFWCQATIETGAPGLRTACSVLRRLGYVVRTSSLGRQITSLGSIKATMIDVRPGGQPDTFPVTEIIHCHLDHSLLT